MFKSDGDEINNQFLGIVYNNTGFWWSYEEGIKDLKEHIIYSLKTNPNFEKEIVKSIYELLENYTDEDLTFFYNKMLDKSCLDCEDGYISMSYRMNEIPNDKRRERIFFENIYYDLFNNNKEFFKENIIKYLFDFQETFAKRILVFKDFSFLTKDTNFDNEKRFSEFYWARVHINKFTKHTAEICFRLQGDPKYKYIVLAADAAHLVYPNDGKFPSVNFLQKILAVTHDDKIEVINDFTEENTPKIKEIEEYYLSKAKASSK